MCCRSSACAATSMPDSWRIAAAYTNFKPPISLLVPAYNEAVDHRRIGAFAAAADLLRVRDHRHQRRIERRHAGRAAARVRADPVSPKPIGNKLPTQPERGIWRSMRHPNLRVIDKENGGKADALNVGINAARYPLFCAVDADSILQRNSLQLIVQPFIEDATHHRCRRHGARGERLRGEQRLPDVRRAAAQAAAVVPDRRIPARLPVRPPRLVARSMPCW